MMAQPPAEGILVHHDWGNSKLYQVACECVDRDCGHTVFVEAEDTRVTVTTYTQQKTNFCSITRWYHIWQLLTKGYVKYEAAIYMTEQQALNYSEVLKSAMLDVKEFKKVNWKN